MRHQPACQPTAHSLKSLVLLRYSDIPEEGLEHLAWSLQLTVRSASLLPAGSRPCSTWTSAHAGGCLTRSWPACPRCAACGAWCCLAARMSPMRASSTWHASRSCPPSTCPIAARWEAPRSSSSALHAAGAANRSHCGCQPFMLTRSALLVARPAWRHVFLGPSGCRHLDGSVRRHTNICAVLPQITDAGLLLLTQLSRLETLDLSGCVGVTKKGIRALAAALKSLHSLKLGGTSRVATIQDGSVAAIAAMTSLTHLDLSGSHDISDEGEAPACLQLPELISSNDAHPAEVPAALWARCDFGEQSC